VPKGFWRGTAAPAGGGAQSGLPDGAGGGEVARKVRLAVRPVRRQPQRWVRHIAKCRLLATRAGVSFKVMHSKQRRCRQMHLHPGLLTEDGRMNRKQSWFVRSGHAEGTQ